METRQKNLYAALGVKKNATKEEIKAAFKKIASRTHPDITGGNKTTDEEYSAASEAYAVLKDDKKRREYDFNFKDPLEEGPIKNNFGSTVANGSDDTKSSFDALFKKIFGDQFGIFKGMFDQPQKKPRNIYLQTESTGELIKILRFERISINQRNQINEEIIKRINNANCDGYLEDIITKNLGIDILTGRQLSKMVIITAAKRISEVGENRVLIRILRSGIRSDERKLIEIELKNRIINGKCNDCLENIIHKKFGVDLIMGILGNASDDVIYAATEKARQLRQNKR